MGGVKVGKKFYKLVIKYYDDESTPAVAAQMAEHLIKRDGVKFMLGPYSSGITMAVSPVTERHRVPLVDAEANARSLFTRGYPQKTKLVYCKDTNPAWRSSGADHGHAPSESPCARCVGTSCGGTDSVFMPLWHTSRTASGSTMT